MPLLPSESFVFPPDLFRSPRPELGHSLPWRILHTELRANMTVARRLLAAGVGFSLPVDKEQSRRRSWWSGARTLPTGNSALRSLQSGAGA